MISNRREVSPLSEKEKVSEELQKTVGRNHLVRFLLKEEPDWTKWLPHHILAINSDLFKAPEKKTLYVMKKIIVTIKYIRKFLFFIMNLFIIF